MVKLPNLEAFTNTQRLRLTENLDVITKKLVDLAAQKVELNERKVRIEAEFAEYVIEYERAKNREE